MSNVKDVKAEKAEKEVQDAQEATEKFISEFLDFEGMSNTLEMPENVDMETVMRELESVSKMEGKNLYAVGKSSETGYNAEVEQPVEVVIKDKTISLIRLEKLNLVLHTVKVQPINLEVEHYKLKAKHIEKYDALELVKVKKASFPKEMLVNVTLDSYKSAVLNEQMIVRFEDAEAKISGSGRAYVAQTNSLIEISE